jgi:hypothetical protein
MEHTLIEDLLYVLFQAISCLTTTCSSTDKQPIFQQVYLSIVVYLAYLNIGQLKFAFIAPIRTKDISWS